MKKPQKKQSWREQQDLLKQFTGNYTLSYCEELYAQEGSPLAVWEAFLTARKTGAAPPEWVMAAFEKWASNIMALESSGDAAVASALEFKTDRGGETKARSYPAHNNHLEIAQYVAILMGDKGVSTFTEARGLAADQFSVSVGTVKHAWAKHRDALGFPAKQRKEKKSDAELMHSLITRRW